MLRLTTFLFALLLLTGGATAATRCLLLVEAGSGAVVHREGARCDEPLGPASTFKLPLAVIGFDVGILEDAEHPAWPYLAEYGAVRAADKATTTPRKWLADSVLWFSRKLVRELGAERFAAAVRNLDYGNADVSGDPGAGNGMTHSWLNSSLQITPVEQARFVRRLLLADLPVGETAAQAAINALPQFDGGNGWLVVGKTGTGFIREASRELGDRQFGWFVGWGQRAGEVLVFAYLIEDEEEGGSAAGLRARDDLLGRWPELATR
ncbi:MAG TPA: penicillin-binding transpeptidase domain-containing protein [Devosia sp.]|jgi:beta-lactamase class D|nr:penicillin-binding transpeptidase domain-containing protein [Devosia sp.]